MEREKMGKEIESSELICQDGQICKRKLKEYGISKVLQERIFLDGA
jgi:hypothetical protein